MAEPSPETGRAPRTAVASSVARAGSAEREARIAAVLALLARGAPVVQTFGGTLRVREIGGVRITSARLGEVTLLRAILPSAGEVASVRVTRDNRGVTTFEATVSAPRFRTCWPSLEAAAAASTAEMGSPSLTPGAAPCGLNRTPEGRGAALGKLSGVRARHGAGGADTIVATTNALMDRSRPIINPTRAATAPAPAEGFPACR